MKICAGISEGVEAILKIYDRQAAPWQYESGTLCDTLRLGDEALPLFWWRTDTQVAQMLALAPERKLCSMKLNRTCTKSEGIHRLLYRELDMAVQMLGAPVATVMCFQKPNSLAMIATLKNSCVAVFELAAVLCDGTPEQGRHTYWGADGMASDRVVSQKVPSEAVYLFTDGNTQAETYNDIFLHTYGLNKEDSVKAAAISEILMGRTDTSDWCTLDKHYRRCIDAAMRSAQTGKPVNVEDVQ